MIDEKKKKVIEFYNAGIEKYFGKNFTEAAAYFKKALETDPEDGPSKLQYLRCLEYIKEAPPPDWDGVFTMVSK